MKELRADLNINAGYFRKELENIRRSQEKLENSFTETQIELKALKSRMNNAEEWISDLEDRIMEIPQSGQQTENQMKTHESNIRDLWDNIKASQSRHNRDSRRRRTRKGDWKYIWRNYGWKLSMLKGNSKIQEEQRAPNKLNPNRPAWSHIIIKMAKGEDKRENSKVSKKKTKS